MGRFTHICAIVALLTFNFLHAESRNAKHYPDPGLITPITEWYNVAAPDEFHHAEAEEEHVRIIRIPLTWKPDKLRTDSSSSCASPVVNLRTNLIFLESGQFGLRIPPSHGLIHTTLRDPFGRSVLLRSETKESVRQTAEKFRPYTYYFYATPGQYQLTLEILDKKYPTGGITQQLLIGSAEKMRSRFVFNSFVEFFIFSSLFVLGLYHLILHRSQESGRTQLFFGLLLIAVSFRALGMGESPLFWLFPDFPDLLHTQMLYVCFILGVPFFINYMHNLYPDEIPDKVCIVTHFFSGLALILQIFPIDIAYLGIRILEGYTTLLLPYIGFLLFRAYQNKRPGAKATLMIAIPFIFTVIHDILVDNLILFTPPISPFGMFLFLSGQSLILSYLTSKSVIKFKALNENISKLVKSNERFVPKHMLQLLGKDKAINVKLGDSREINAVILFADIRSFTTMSENLTPEKIFQLLNVILSKLSPIIRKNHGYIDKYLGDAIMAVFSGSASDAARTALEINQTLQDMEAELAERHFPPVKMGIGIHRGTCLLGTLGEDARMDGTVISDAVNVASRLQELTRLFGVDTLVSFEVARELFDYNFIFRPLGIMRLRGKSDQIRIFDFLDFSQKAYAESKAFTKSLRALDEGNLEEALVFMQAHVDCYKEDRTAIRILEIMKNDEERSRVLQSWTPSIL